MTCGIVLFRTVNGGYFKYAVEKCNAGLFVELRTLGEISVFVKVFQFKNIRPTLRAGGNNFRSMNFGKAL